MNKIFLTFADSRLKKSLTRVAQEATEMGIYSSVLTLTESDLSPTFIARFKDKLNSSVRGFGYWCWKPQIIKQTLEGMEDGDLLQYCDVGCHLNIGGKDRLLQYFDILAKDSIGLIAFQAKIPSAPFKYDGRPLLDLRDKFWIKGDLLDYFGVRNRLDVIDTQTIGAGILFLRKTKTAMEVIDEWLNVYDTNFSLVDDSPSLSQNLNNFIEHRHDQSIFSILCKLRGVETISAYEYWYPSKFDSTKSDWGALKNYPIWAMRNKDFGFMGNIKMWFRSKYIALIKKLRY